MSALMDRARELVDSVIPAALAVDGLETVAVTLDALEIPAALANGPVVMLNPPTLTHETFDYTVATWDLLVIAGPPHDALAAWDTIATIMDALDVPLAVDTATPASFNHPGIPDHPAYQLAFTEAL